MWRTRQQTRKKSAMKVKRMIMRRLKKSHRCSATRRAIPNTAEVEWRTARRVRVTTNCTRTTQSKAKGIPCYTWKGEGRGLGGGGDVLIFTIDRYIIWSFVFFFRVYTHDDNLRTEPKFIIFVSQLLILFKFCFACKFDNPLVRIRSAGTMVEVTTTCSNPKCPRKETTWKSQPPMPGTRIPAGNFLLCMSNLVSGASASKVLQVFRNMGLACLSLSTYFEHQCVSHIIGCAFQLQIFKLMVHFSSG